MKAKRYSNHDVCLFSYFLEHEIALRTIFIELQKSQFYEYAMANFLYSNKMNGVALPFLQQKTGTAQICGIPANNL